MRVFLFAALAAFLVGGAVKAETGERFDPVLDIFGAPEQDRHRVAREHALRLAGPAPTDPALLGLYNQHVERTRLNLLYLADSMILCRLEARRAVDPWAILSACEQRRFRQ